MTRPDPTNLQSRLAAVLVGRFEVLDLIGVGGYAAVFRARDLVLEREVAIKVFEAGVTMDLDQCLVEARLVATIEHPHIVPLHEVGHESGIVFLVMRLFPDGSLADRLHQLQFLPPDEVVRLGATVAGALAVAHRRGVIHLDVKPDNILLDADGRAAVTDFGIAQAVGIAGGENVSRGTPHYMSPEHVSGDVLDARSDVYALGVVLYEAASGRTPITGTTATQVMANQVRQIPPALDETVAGFPTALSKVIAKALAKNPAERWASIAEFGTALHALEGSEQLLSPKELGKRHRRRWYKRSAIGCGLVVVGVAFAIWAGIRVFNLVTGGPRPAVDLMAPMIPPGVLDSLEAHGLTAEGDSVQYVFIPAKGGAGEGLVITKGKLHRIYKGMPTQWVLHSDDSYSVSFKNRERFFVRIDGATGVADTLYTTLGGREMLALRDGIKAIVLQQGSQ